MRHYPDGAVTTLTVASRRRCTISLSNWISRRPPLLFVVELFWLHQVPSCSTFPINNSNVKRTCRSFPVNIATIERSDDFTIYNTTFFFLFIVRIARSWDLQHVLVQRSTFDCYIKLNEKSLAAKVLRNTFNKQRYSSLSREVDWRPNCSENTTASDTTWARPNNIL